MAAIAFNMQLEILNELMKPFDQKIKKDEKRIGLLITEIGIRRFLPTHLIEHFNTSVEYFDTSTKYFTFHVSTENRNISIPINLPQIIVDQLLEIVKNWGINQDPDALIIISNIQNHAKIIQESIIMSDRLINLIQNSNSLSELKKDFLEAYQAYLDVKEEARNSMESSKARILEKINESKVEEILP